MSNYREKIIQLRKDKKISEYSIANKLGISRMAYRKFEQGNKDLTLPQINTAAKFLKTRPEEIIFTDIQENMNKYTQMIFAFLREIGGDGKIPKTKLAKLLYLADFVFYYENHASMSGMAYRKIKHGPVPDEYFVLLGHLSDEGFVVIEPKNKALLVSETRAGERISDDMLSKKEKSLIKKIAKRWKGKSTQEIVNFTHNQFPYMHANNKEIVSYDLILQEDPEYVF